MHERKHKICTDVLPDSIFNFKDKGGGEVLEIPDLFRIAKWIKDIRTQLIFEPDMIDALEDHTPEISHFMNALAQLEVAAGSFELAHHAKVLRETEDR